MGRQGLGLGLICNDAAKRGFLRPPSSAPEPVAAAEAMVRCGDQRGQRDRSHAACALLHVPVRLRVRRTWLRSQTKASSAPASLLANESLQSYVGHCAQPIGTPVSRVAAARMWSTDRAVSWPTSHFRCGLSGQGVGRGGRQVLPRPCSPVWSGPGSEGLGRGLGVQV